jgi:hypothetical protein
VLESVNGVACTSSPSSTVSCSNANCTQDYECGGSSYRVLLAGYDSASQTYQWHLYVPATDLLGADQFSLGPAPVVADDPCFSAGGSGGGGNACSTCLANCDGLPGCCTGCNCLCEDQCGQCF